MQVEGFIDQNTEISKEFSLWNSSGSSYTRGNMFVIPIEDSMVYVEPIYLEATSGSLPEVKRVIIYYNDRIAYEETLAKALDVMFGEGAGTPLNGDDYEEPDEPGGEDPTPGEPGDPIEAVDNLIRKAVDAYNNAKDAQEQGNWASYGEYINELESYLNELNDGGAGEEAPAPIEIDPETIEEVVGE